MLSICRGGGAYSGATGTIPPSVSQLKALTVLWVYCVLSVFCFEFSWTKQGNMVVKLVETALCSLCFKRKKKKKIEKGEVCLAVSYQLYALTHEQIINFYEANWYDSYWAWRTDQRSSIVGVNARLLRVWLVSDHMTCNICCLFQLRWLCLFSLLFDPFAFTVQCEFKWKSFGYDSTRDK